MTPDKFQTHSCLAHLSWKYCFLWLYLQHVHLNFLIWNSFMIFWIDRWKESLNRLKRIFGLNAQGKYTDKPVYYIPGNHDIGYESLHYAMPKVFQHVLALLLMFKLPKGCFRWYLQYIATMEWNAKCMAKNVVIVM